MPQRLNPISGSPQVSNHDTTAVLNFFTLTPPPLLLPLLFLHVPMFFFSVGTRLGVLVVNDDPAQRRVAQRK